MNAFSMEWAFGAYVILVATAVVGVLVRYLPRRVAGKGTAALLLWLGYAGIIGRLGLLRDPSLRPPGMVYLALPLIAFVVLVIARGRGGEKLAARIPLWLLLGFQVFRVGVEMVLQGLHDIGQIPRLMTLEGGNVEILVALSAPLVAWLATRGVRGRRWAWGWNLVGLLSLVNVVARSVLTTPGPLNLIPVEVPNSAIGNFPFSFIPGLMVPLALTLHILSFRAMRMQLRPGGARQSPARPH